MKTLICLLITVCLYSCSSSQETLAINQENLVGTWTLTERYASPGDGSGEFMPVNDGYSFTLNSDGTFTSERLSECTTGTYELMGADQILFAYDCPDFSELYEDRIRFDGSKLVSTQIKPIKCIEACYDKFTKQ